MIKSILVVAAALVIVSATVPLSALATTDARDEASEFKDDMPCLLSGGAHPSCPEHDETTGDCPEGYNNNERDQCFPEHDDCPKGTESRDDDETGACHPGSSDGAAGN